MKLWGEVLGVNARYEQVTISELAKDIPGTPGIELGEMMA